MESFSVWLHLIYCKANDINNKGFDYCKTMNVEIEKKIENRHSYCLRTVIFVPWLLYFMSAAKELLYKSQRRSLIPWVFRVPYVLHAFLQISSLCKELYIGVSQAETKLPFPRTWYTKCVSKPEGYQWSLLIILRISNGKKI